MSFIEIKDLHKKYKDNVVLNGINLSIEKGNVIGIIGPSGTVNLPYFAASTSWRYLKKAAS